MKKSKLTKLTSLAVTLSVMMSLAGFVLADEVENVEVPDTPAVEQTEGLEPSEPEIISPDDAEDQEGSAEATEATEESAVESPVTDTEVTEPAAEDPELIEETGSGSAIYEGFFEVTMDPLDAGVYSDVDNDELAEQYIMNEMSIDIQNASNGNSFDYTNGLSSDEMQVYSILREAIRNIADGNRTDTKIAIPDSYLNYEFTAEQLGVTELVQSAELGKAIGEAVSSEAVSPNVSRIMDSVINASPYELYWFMKTYRFGFGYYINNSTQTVIVHVSSINLNVAQEYQNGDTYTMSSEYGTAVRTAANNARSIIEAYANYDDYNKLLAYNNVICDMVEYNHKAADTEGYPYGNPWQLVWVFDGDPETKVVCEGYSKAFQYLCDNSVFTGNTYTLSVPGYAVFSDENQGGHMWNVVHLDGQNYMVDVTNNDHRNPMPYFLIGYTSVYTDTANNLTGYTYGSSSYYYYNDTLESFGTAALTISDKDYVYSPITANAFCGHAMQITDQIGLQFFVELPANADPDDYYVTFTDNHNHLDPDVQYVLTSSSKVSNANIYMAQVDLTAIQMADLITPILHHKPDGAEVTGPAYSAQDYINWGRARSNTVTTDAEKTILNSLADYGYYAQVYLSRVRSWTIGTDYSGMNSSETTYNYNEVMSAVAGNALSCNLDPSVFESGSYSLQFGNTVTLNIYLRPASGVVIDTDAFSIDAGGRKCVIEQSGGRYVIRISGIPAGFLREQFVISYNGRRIITLSPMSYVYDMLRTTAADDGRNAVCALYAFARACGGN